MAHHLIQLLLPVADNTGHAYPDSVLESVKKLLVNKFGGVTAFEMSPAQGVWTSNSDRKSHDDIIMIEVMVDDIDSGWWGEFRNKLESDLQQEEILIRACPIRKL